MIKQEIVRLTKYGIVGVLNTAITFLTFILLRYWGVGLNISNFFSYVTGIINSFLWNRAWVFKAKNRAWTKQLFLFFSSAAICWGIQWIVFRILLLQCSEVVAQLIGMVIYTLLNYAFNRLFTFK